jgi:16S rRNA (cytosine967-C5)-methyltransferase
LPELLKALDYDDELLDELRRVYGRALGSFLSWLTRPPERYYVRVNMLKASPAEVLDELRSMGFEAYLDEVLEEAIWLPVRGPEKLSTDAACTIVVDKRAAESIMLGAHVYAPGVVEVRGSCGKGSEAIVVAEPLEDVVVAEAIVENPKALELGRGMVARNVKPLYRVPSFRATELYARGAIYEQSLPSMIPARLLVEDEKPRIVVDMCAAPGGKTGHVIELTRGSATVYAFDHSRRKIDKMKEELARLGHLGRDVRVLRADSRYLDVDFPELVGRVDAIILDPPCTALGVVPKLYDRKTGSDVANASTYQKQFIKVAAKLLRPCGVLVYSTCTVTIAENEEVVYYAEELGFRAEEPLLRHPRSSKGIGLAEALRFHPHVHGLPGYFVAKLRKKC